MDLKKIKQVIRIVENANINYLSVESNGTKIKVKKEAPCTVMPKAAEFNLTANGPIQTEATDRVELSLEKNKLDMEEGIVAIKSQMVGTFYSSPNPEAEDYIKKGSVVKSGQVVCIIEAMKLFNEIVSEISGTIVECCVKNGSPVEYGQNLFFVRPG
ncbi:MAG: acetyl-CoA carboxylase biotin carboxyl carrier protein [bacterium]|nr:acetyl-CoA carboxylase biotin carboxyl carrier protein [bacterium]